MTINLADNTPRVSYAVAAGVTQTSFTVSFEFFDDADLNVYVDGTLKTLTTDYTVTGGDGATGSITMSVTGAAGGSTVVITRDIDLKRTTDFPASGAFQVGSLNTELDKLIAIAADLDDKASRALQLTDYDTAVSLVLPDVDTRKGTVLAFDSSTGAVTTGPTSTNVNTLADVADDIATLADIEDGTDATDAIQTVAGISANVTTVAGVSSNVTTVAGQTTNMQNITDNLSAVQNAATNATTASTKATEAATSATNAATSATAAAASATSASTAQTAAETAETNAETAETNAETAQTAAETAQTAAETAKTAAETAETNASTSATTATTKASEAATSATNAATSATSASIAQTAAETAQTAAEAAQAAAELAADNFDDTYLGSKASDPTVDNDGDALNAGDLYFNTTSSQLKYYTGSAWVAVVPGISDVVSDTTPQLGGNLDVNGNSIVSASNGNINITPNGTGSVVIDGLSHPQSDGSAGQFLKTDGSGQLSFGTVATDLSGDSTPQLGGVLDTNGNNINFADNDKAQFGTGNDLQIYHDGSNSHIVDAGTGNLAIRSPFAAIKNANNTETMASFSANGAVKLFYDNAKKIETTSTGIDVTGTAEMDTLSIGGTAVTSTAAELNILDGVTATASELNIMDGVTATTAELNKMDGVTATTTEINYLDGVTSNIQTQLNNAGAPAVNSSVHHGSASASGSSGNYNVASVTITPSSSSAKIFLVATSQVYAGGNAATFYARIRRGTTTVSQTHYSSLSNYGKYEAIACCEIDAPGTTAAQTYHMHVGWSGGSGSASYPQQANASICAIEVH